MNKRIDRKTRFTGCLILLAIVIYSFLGTQLDVPSEYAGDGAGSQYRLESQNCLASEVVYFEKTLQRYSQSFLRGQLKVQRKSIHYDGNVYAPVVVLFYAGILFSILSLYYFIINCSNRFVIRYIHNKDGKKA